jgi:hypothetical protein
MSEASVRITRPSSLIRGRLPVYRVELDGDVVDKIGSSEVVDLNVEPGHHRLRIQGGWTGSQALSFEARRGATTYFECRPNGHSLTALINTFKPLHKHGEPWVDLQDVSDEDVAERL